MEKNELKTIVAGASYTSGSFLNSLVRLINSFLELGRNIGSAIHYVIYKKTC